MDHYFFAPFFRGPLEEVSTRVVSDDGVAADGVAGASFSAGSLRL